MYRLIPCAYTNTYAVKELLKIRMVRSTDTHQRKHFTGFTESNIYNI